MATAMHLCGVKTPSSAFSRRALHCQHLAPKHRLNFVASVASISDLCRTSESSYRGRVLRISCNGGNIDVLQRSETRSQGSDGVANELTCVMKFGGSSVASAERMREVAELILSFPEERPVIVLSAMGKTTNKLLLAGEKAVSCGVSNVSDIDELTILKELHLRTVVELGIERSIISSHLEELEQLLNGIAMMKEMTPRTRDFLVSFGECMSTRIFAAYLNKIGVKARQYDAFDIGFITTDDFTNADILEAAYPAVAKRLHGDWIVDPAIPVVTGFLGKGWKSCAVTTLGRGGSDLTGTTIGKALGLNPGIMQVHSFELGIFKLSHSCMGDMLSWFEIAFEARLKARRKVAVARLTPHWEIQRLAPHLAEAYASRLVKAWALIWIKKKS